MTEAMKNHYSWTIDNLTIFHNSNNKQFFIIFILIFHSLFSTGQSLCEPFYIVDLSNKDKIWKAVFSECIEIKNSIIKTDDNPQIRANLIHQWKIKKIIRKEFSDSLPSIEYFNERGYPFFVDSYNDTSNGQFLNNYFNQSNLLTKIIYQNSYSISGIRQMNADTFHFIEEFKYDTLNRLKEKKGIQPIFVKKIVRKNGRCKYYYYRKPRFRTFIQYFNYDSNGNITELSTSSKSKDIFYYDSNNKLIKASDLTPNLGNAETYNFQYNDNGQILSILVTSKDTSIFKAYNIKFEYGSDNDLVDYTEYYPDGKLWTNTKYKYSEGKLSEIYNSPFSLSSSKKIYYNDIGLIKKIEYYSEKTLTRWTDYLYEYYD